MIRKKVRLMLLLVVMVVCLLIAVNFVGDIMIRVPAFRELRVDKVCLYDGDRNGDSLVAKKIIKVESRKTLEERLDVVVKELQRKFSDIELEIVGYDSISEKKVLILDLKDKDVSVDKYINAGSTGSRINLGILVNSLLQNGREVQNWIDGVKILVNGEEGIETSHISFSGVFYRMQDDLYLQ